MKYIIDYNKYNTGNPYEDPYLYEGKGVPHILKWLVNKITDDIDINNKYNIDIDESDLKLKNLEIQIFGLKVHMNWIF